MGGEVELCINSGSEGQLKVATPSVPALLPPGAAAVRPAPLLPERSDFLDGDAPAAKKVEAFLAKAFAAMGENRGSAAGALVPWICDVLLSNHSVKGYGRDLMDFVRHMQAQGVSPLEVTADHMKCYKRALLEAGMKSATVARRLSVLRGTYHQLAAKGLIAWETAQDAAGDLAPGGDPDRELAGHQGPRAHERL